MFSNLCRRYLLTVLSSFQWLKYFISSRKIEEVSVTLPQYISVFTFHTEASCLNPEPLFCPLGMVEFTMKLVKLKLQDLSLAEAPSQVSEGPSIVFTRSFCILLKRAPQTLKLPALQSQTMAASSNPPRPTESPLSSHFFPGGKRLLVVLTASST